MVDAKVKCDKPYDLDQADKARGKPRRRRKDAHTTAYELNIRLNKEQRALFDGKKKFTRVVYAKNKRVDLVQKCRDFEAEIEAKIREAVLSAGKRVSGEEETVSAIVRAYLKSREKIVVSRYIEDSLSIAERYIDATIGSLGFDELTVERIENALNRIPDISRELNEAKRARQEAARCEKKKRQRSGEDQSGTHYVEFRPVRQADLPTQHKVLVLLKQAGNYAVDLGIVEHNIFNNGRLARQYPKSRPLIDPFTEEEARYIFQKIEELPLGVLKVELHMLFILGLRPVELLKTTFADLNLRDRDRGYFHIVKRGKTVNAARSIELGPDTTSLLADWRRSREEFAKATGIVFTDKWLICSEDGQKAVYNTLKERWRRFLKNNCGLEHRRPYAMRHTFATLNGRNNIDVKTLSTLMGHASPAFTLAVYAGYFEPASMPVTAAYSNYLRDNDKDG